MWPFGKKNTVDNQQADVYKIQVIPEDFYGGKDPVVHYQGRSVKSAEKNLSIADGESSFFSRFWENKKLRYGVFGILILLVLVLSTWYYVSDALKSGVSQGLTTNTLPLTNESLNTASDNIESSSTSTSLDSIEPTSTESLGVPTTTPTLGQTTLFFPEINNLDMTDVDKDSLTDQEEDIYTTDPGKWDTDGDGYYDGLELTNLYNPKGSAPVKLIDSGLVSDYINPVWNYRIYYPISWVVGNVDPASNQVLFTAANGDYISVEVYQKNQGEQFVDWFARVANGQQYSDLQTFKNRFQEDGLKRLDDLVAYFEKDNNVYLLAYHSNNTGPISYRHIIQMMVNSFRPVRTTLQIPDQKPLPIEPNGQTTNAPGVSSSTMTVSSSNNLGL